ncbi:FAD-dependent oxidoreductase [Allonocardiopsis opalescens]|uniref:Assimilatory nitrate reductase electron transfer subunit n=1 Tax=Allonocardiopsis opalescens TaxID=1144618 RepID=A0A2T0PXJ4_9ACTN|nr:FAD-dependent oxidoreductase [Allonocardiopsis opalescens]PRX96255.1 assimilatory nitrate reductase electron transfer subunit [Allonocardiopsis opalescens]
MTDRPAPATRPPVPGPRRVVVLGHGMVGARFAEEVRSRDPDGRRVHLTVVGADADGAYNRVLLPEVVAGRLLPEELALPEPAGPGTAVRTGVAATAIDREARRVALDDGSELDYDELVLATGARAGFPPVDGLGGPDAPAPGVTALRDLADCRRLTAMTAPGTPVVVLGGGVLGLEAARALNGRGARVSVVEAAPWLMRRQLDKAAAGILAERFTALGIAVHPWRVAARWRPGTGLELDDGRMLAADALVVAAGVRARDELAAAAGIAVDQGVVVDDRLTSSDPRVHALGDCARHPGGGAGLVQPGWEQAAVLADLVTGADPAARYRGAHPVTRLKAEGIELTSLGEVETDDSAPGADAAQTVTVSDPHGGRYGRLTITGGRVTGAILLGFPDSAAAITQLYDDGAPVPDDRLGLLLGRAAPEPASAGPADADALVCRCNGVRSSRIESAWLDGARTREDIARTTRATTGCGGCTRDVNAFLAAMGAGDPSRGTAT